MSDIQQLREAMIANAMANGHNETFLQNMNLIRILFKLEVIGRESHWNYNAGAFMHVHTPPV